MKLKPSAYNHFVRLDDDRVLAYNAFKNTLAEVSASQFAIIEDILARPDVPVDECTDAAQLRRDLVEGHFLVDDALDELGLLRLNHTAARFAGGALGLTIAPTLACNFQCVYCFEESCAEHMSQETEQAVVRFVQRRASRLRSLSVTWFGGEPTLRLDTIERLTRAFRDVCAQHEIVFQPASIITNGYLLDRPTAEALTELGVSDAQVTIDGPPEIHDQRRPLRGGQGTFERIVANIKASMDVLPIVIRVNVDRTNASRIDEFYDALADHGLLGKVPFYFARVDSATEACADIASSCYTVKEHSDLVVQLHKDAMSKGVRTHVGYPSTRHFGNCTAGSINGYVVSPTGMLFKCWNDIGPGAEKSVGSVHDDAPSADQLGASCRYLNWDPFSRSECQTCSLVPVCAGGCLHRSLATGEPDCSQFRFNLHEMLRLKHRQLTAAATTPDRACT